MSIQEPHGITYKKKSMPYDGQMLEKSMPYKVQTLFYREVPGDAETLDVHWNDEYQVSGFFFWYCSSSLFLQTSIELDPTLAGETKSEGGSRLIPPLGE